MSLASRDPKVQMYPVLVEKVVATLGGERTLGSRLASVDDLQEAVQRGFPRGVVDELAKAAGHSRENRRRVAHLVASEATLKRSKVLSPAASERAERLARVTALSLDAFGDAVKSQEWLHKPNSMLGSAPIATAVSDLGARQVEQLLANIEFGLPA